MNQRSGRGPREGGSSIDTYPGGQIPPITLTIAAGVIIRKLKLGNSVASPFLLTKKSIESCNNICEHVCTHTDT